MTYRDQLALETARQILAAARGPELPGGDVQLLAQFQVLVATALDKFRPAPLTELMPGADATLQQSLAVIDQQRLRRYERERAEQAGNRDERRGGTWPFSTK